MKISSYLFHHLRVGFFWLIVLCSACGDKEEINPDKRATRACFEHTVNGSVGNTLSFNSDCSANATSYRWDFAGEGTSTDPSPTFTFTSPGTKIVVLIVSDGTVSDTIAKDINITSFTSSACIVHHNLEKITSDVTWKTGEVHCVEGYLLVEGATLTIQPGVIVSLSTIGAIDVGHSGEASALKAQGTADNPIIFTSSKDEPQAGDWGHVGFYEGTSLADNIVDHCIFQYGGTPSFSTEDKPGMLHIGRDGTVSVTNTTFRHSLTYAVSTDSYSTFARFDNNTISDAGDFAIKTHVGVAHSIGTGNNINSPGIYVSDGTVIQDVTWRKQTCPYYVRGHLAVGSSEGNVLTLEPGIEIQFDPDFGYMQVGYSSLYSLKGAVRAVGTAQEPIVFTSAAENPAPGDWSGITFGEGATDETVLDHVIVEYASGTAESSGSINIQSDNVSITNSQLRHGSGIGIYLEGEFRAFSNNRISSHSASALRLSASVVNTIGEGNQFSSSDPVFVTGGAIIGKEFIWRNVGMPYMIEEELRVGVYNDTVSSHLIFEPGCELMFMPHAGITFSNYTAAKLSAIGTADQPIVFTSAQDEGKRAPGDWDGIELYGHLVEGSVMKYCKVSFGGERYANITVNGVANGEPTISHCTVTDSKESGIYVYQANPTLVNNQFANNATVDIER